MSKTTKTGGGEQEKAASAKAKDKVVKPETEEAVKDAAAAISGTAKHAAGVAQDQAENAKTTAQEAVGVAREEAENQAGNIKQQAKARAEQAKSRAYEARDEAQRRAHDEAENRKRQATGAMSTTASDLRKASESVEETWLSKSFATAAGQIEDVTRSIENKSPEELVSVARNAARNNPGLFLAGCFAAGVAISRTLKVAAQRQPDHLYDDGGSSRSSAYGGSSADRERASYGGAEQRDTTASGDLPDVGGSTAPEGQVGIGSGSSVTDGLGSDNR